ncbi:S8 family peptidase [Variovorax sp. EL159]|uniref:S8 family peptidase n=1 Tax=Variovorax sp. EL159 TaxID=1566270 RepID=UPI000B858F2F|nr:S8 family peptidase [Variovorax sp. EL159]
MRPTLHVPGHARQAERLAPRFQSLQAAFDARRLELQASAQNSDPDLVVVFVTVGAVNDFISSAERIPGLEWLAAMIEAQVEPDEDFYSTQDADKALSGKLFLMGSNRQALEEVVRLWELYRSEPTSDLGKGLSAWKGLFLHLKEVRFWGPQDRLGDELRQAWRFRLETGAASLKFEIEAWCFSSPVKNTASSTEVRALVGELGGRVLDERLILDIAYHGFLVEVPAQGVHLLLGAAAPPLLRSERVMFMRPRGQASARAGDGAARLPDLAVPQQRVSGAPVVAMLDGLPLANHARLQGRLIVDDPDQWAEAYPAAERVHGTAMASLIAWGELDAAGAPLSAPIYVRPILRPDPNSNPREECTPDDRLLVDLVHVAVRRIFEGAPGVPPAAPTVRVINLSVGDRYRPFAGDLSPWARLLDWLSYKYKVLFVVSSGNRADDLVLNVARESLQNLTREAQASASMLALVQQDMHRRLLAPAESVNALTVGASYSDGSTFATVPGRYALFPEYGIAPYSCIGPGFRRAIKPEILLPGGRALYRERPVSPPAETHLSGVWHTPQPPGQRVAVPMDAAGDTIYTRGTSNAAALATRWAAQTFGVLEALRAGNPNGLPSRYDAVMIKALLAHGASLGNIEDQVLAARPDVVHWHAQRRLVSRYAGYGVADVDRALTCTEQRATMLGVGELRNEKAWEFRVPVPEALNATLVKRRLTVTLSWFTPPNARHSKYRTARLWVDLPDDPLRLTRLEGEARQLQLGTLQHETFEGEGAVPVIPGQNLVIRVNCLADAGRLDNPVEFALCVSLEVAEGVALPIYEQVRARITPRVAVGVEASR